MLQIFICSRWRVLSSFQFIKNYGLSTLNHIHVSSTGTLERVTRRTKLYETQLATKPKAKKNHNPTQENDIFNCILPHNRAIPRNYYSSFVPNLSNPNAFPGSYSRRYDFYALICIDFVFVYSMAKCIVSFALFRFCGSGLDLFIRLILL